MSNIQRTHDGRELSDSYIAYLRHVIKKQKEYIEEVKAKIEQVCDVDYMSRTYPNHRYNDAINEHFKGVLDDI